MADLDDLRLDTAPPHRRASRWWIPLLAGAVFVGTGGAAWWTRASSATPALVALPEARPQPSPATAPAEHSGIFTAAGYVEIEPPGPWIVTAQVPGMIAQVHVVEGQAVTAGELVAAIDETPAILDEAVAVATVEVAEAKLQRLLAGFRSEEIAQAEAAVELAQARLVQAQAQRERSTHLLQAGVGTAREAEGAIALAAVAAATVRTQQAELELRHNGTRPEEIAIARADIAQARAALARAQWQRQACRLVAPRAGVVLERLMRPGEWITHNSNQMPPGAVMTIFDPQAVQAWADVNQRDIARVHEGQAVLLTTDAYPEREIQGIIARILPKANLQKNTVQVKIHIPDPPVDLRPETSVRVTFLLDPSPKEVAHGQP